MPADAHSFYSLRSLCYSTASRTTNKDLCRMNRWCYPACLGELVAVAVARSPRGRSLGAARVVGRSSVGPVTKNELVSFYDVAIPPSAPGGPLAARLRLSAALPAAFRRCHGVGAGSNVRGRRRECIDPNKHR